MLSLFTYQLLQDFHLSLEAIPVSNLRTSDLLDSSSLASFYMCSSTDIAISAFPKLLYKKEVLVSQQNYYAHVYKGND